MAKALGYSGRTRGVLALRVTANILSLFWHNILTELG
jgi:hypothetical protein